MRFVSSSAVIFGLCISNAYAGSPFNSRQPAASSNLQAREQGDAAEAAAQWTRDESVERRHPRELSPLSVKDLEVRITDDLSNPKLDAYDNLVARRPRPKTVLQGEAGKITAANTDGMALDMDGCIAVWIWANGILVGGHVDEGNAVKVVGLVKAALGSAVPTAIHLDYPMTGEADLAAVKTELEKFTSLDPTEEEYPYDEYNNEGWRFVATVNKPGQSVRKE